MAKIEANLGSSWMSATDIRSRTEKARTNRQAHERLLGSLNARQNQRRTELERSLADVPSAQRTPLINKALAGYRNELRNETKDQRLAYVREAAGHQVAVAAAKSHFRSSAQVLARHTIGSERRSRIMEQISMSGPAELASLAELAAATKDMEMGAALCSRVYDLEPSKRPFSASGLADALVGYEFREISQAIMEIERLALESLADDTAFETGRVDNSRSLQIAMMKRAEADVGAYALDEETPDDEEDK